MWRDLYEMLIGTFKDGDYAIGIMMWLLFLVMLGTLLSIIIWAVDSWFMPTFEGQGVIVDKSITPAHSTTNIVKVGNSNIPITTHHKEAYYLDVKIDGRQDSVGVKKKFYKKAQIGDMLRCKYSYGRLFTTSLYIDEIY